MRLLVGGATGYGWVCAFDGDPGSPDPGKWYGSPWVDNDRNVARVDEWGGLNPYFSVALLEEADGLGGRRKQNFKRLLCLPVDDAIEAGIMGTPTWTLETSPGKDQTGVFIDHNDPDAADVDLVSAVMHEMYQRKMLGDRSGNNLMRYVRLPVGTNGKPRDSGPFQHILRIWNPNQVLSLADACAVFGIDLDALRPLAKAAAATDMVALGEGQDRVLAEAVQRIVTGEEYHDSINRVAASMAASGAHPGAVTNLLRAIMSAAQAPRDGRWEDRYRDIPRAVETGSRKFQVEPLAAPGEPETKPELLIRAGTLLNDMKPVQWLIQNWVEREALGVMFGPPNVGKSFCAYDMAFCVATGTPWRGEPVHQGPVVLVVGEGLSGVLRRLQAWSLENKVDVANAPIYITTKAVPMLNGVAASELVAAVDAVVVAGGGVNPVLVVIDTLARNFGDGDENSTQDTSAFVAVVDEHLRRRYRAHVLIVHHSGKDVAAGARGSSALKGAIDQEFSVTSILSGTVIKLASTKMRDAEKPRPMEFKIKKVLIGRNGDDEPIWGAVLEKMGTEFDNVLVAGDKGSWTVGQVLSLQEDGFAPTQQRMRDALGMSSRASETATKRLRERGYVVDKAKTTARPQLSEKALLLLSGNMSLVTAAGHEGDE